MSKVICDVCGTTFPETAAQCPICGSARNGAAQTGAGDGVTQAEAYAYVKGGRFSKNNVKKRNKTGEDLQRRNPESPKKDEGGSSNKGLVIVVVILLLAIIAVCAYIGIRFFMPELKPNETNPPKQTITVAPETTQPQTQTQPTVDASCTKIQLSSTIIEFTDMERSQLLSAVVTPLDTTDELVFTSADPLVATVTEGGLVTPVGSGETIIIVTCGEITEECRVICSFDDTTEPTETEPEEPEVDPSGFEMTFNTPFLTAEGMGDVTLEVGNKWKMYSAMNVDASMVIWSTNDEAYATIEDGVVTAVAPVKPYVLVHAEYNGIKYTCRIRIKGATGTTEATPVEPTPTEPTQAVDGVTLTMNRTDFTLAGAGQTWNVYKGTAISQSVAATDIIWTSENPEIVTIENGVVTAVGSGYTYIHAEYNGQTAVCKVIVK